MSTQYRTRLRKLNMEELVAEQTKIVSDPKNRMPVGSFNIYTMNARKKLNDIAWAISELSKERKKAAEAGIA